MSRRSSKKIRFPERSGRKRSGLDCPGATNYITRRGAKHCATNCKKLRAATGRNRWPNWNKSGIGHGRSATRIEQRCLRRTVTVKDKKGRTETIRRVLRTRSRPGRVSGFSIGKALSWTWATGLRLEDGRTANREIERKVTRDEIEATRCR